MFANEQMFAALIILSVFSIVPDVVDTGSSKSGGESPAPVWRESLPGTCDSRQVRSPCDLAGAPHSRSTSPVQSTFSDDDR